MINAITNALSQDYTSRASSQVAPGPETAVPPSTSNPTSQAGSPAVADSIQLSASALNALDTPEGLFRAASAGNSIAIAIIKEDLTPIPHSLDLMA